MNKKITIIWGTDKEETKTYTFKTGEIKMMYLIIKEIKLSGTSIYNVASFTDNVDKANDMLQGYNLIEKEKNVVYSIVKYEQPLKLERKEANE